MNKIRYISTRLIFVLLFLDNNTIAANKNQIDGHEYVDLGLPSGTLWATCNLGAKYPYNYGNYYAWGETKPKTTYTWETYKYAQTEGQQAKYSEIRTTLSEADDAATVLWGQNWKMPTSKEINKLFNSCYNEFCKTIKGQAFQD